MLRRVFKRLAVLQQMIFLCHGGIDNLSDGAHGVGTLIRLDNLPRRVETLTLARVDGAFQLIELEIDLLFQKIGQRRCCSGLSAVSCFSLEKTSGISLAPIT